MDDRPPYYEGTFRLRHRNGDYRWLYARGQLLLDEDGEPSRFIGTSSDITQRRADEESLRQAAVVFDSTLEGVLVTDRELKIVHVNLGLQPHHRLFQRRSAGQVAEHVQVRPP